MKRFVCLLLVCLLIVTLVPVDTNAATGGKLVALTFDDGPHSTRTEQLLDGLKERGAHVTFFMQGYMAKANLDVVQRVYDEGHEVANHTWNHPEMTGLGNDQIRSQINQTNELLDTVCGKGTSYLIRPPYGSTNARVRENLGAPAIMWSVDTNDWQYGYSHVYNHIINNARDGAIILCHDIHASTIPAALDAIKVLQARGYEFVTVSELYRRRGVEMTNGTRYYKCDPNGVDRGAVQAPVITYEAAEQGGALVTITSPDDAPIYYCTDGSRLNQQSKRYTGSFVVSELCTIKAVAAFNMNGGRSKETTLELKKLPGVAPEVGFEDGMLTLRTDMKNAGVYYTLDGSAATTASVKYSAPVAVQPGTVIRAVAGGGIYETSGEIAAYYSERGNFFADVMPGAWYTEAVDRLAQMGLMNGIGNYEFAPDDDTTRGMMVTLLYRYSGELLEKGWKRTNGFTDVEDKAWYAEAVEWAYRNDVVEGYPGNVFKPEQSISRQEMAHMMANFLSSRGNALPDGEDCRTGFGDGKTVAQWALDSVNAVVAAGLLRGDERNLLCPENTATRAEFGTVLLRMMDLEEKMEQEREEAENTPPETTEPSVGTEPTEPIEPTEETEPTETTEVTEPAESTEPSEDMEPIEPIEPTQETEPTEATEVTEPEETTESTEMTENTEPTEPMQPTEETKESS